MGGMGRASGSFMSSVRRDQSVKQAALSPGVARRIMGFARPFRGRIAAFLVLVVISSVLVVATPLLLKRIIDQGVVPGDKSVVVSSALLVAAIAVLDALLGLVERFLSSSIGEGLIYSLRVKVFAHVQRMPIAFFTRTQTGSLVTRLNSDVIGAQQAFTSTLSSVVSNVVTLVVVLITMLALSWQITLVALVMLPLFVIPAQLLGRRLAKISREAMQLNAELGQTMTERFNVAGAMLVKIFGHLPREEEEFSSKALRVRDIGIRSAMFGRFLYTALVLVAALATALVYGAGGIFVIDGKLEVGALVAMAALLGRLYGPLTALSNVQVDVMTALVSFDRVFEVLDLEPLVRDREDAVELPADSSSVSFDHVAFSYPAASEVSLASLESVAVLDQSEPQPVLRDISFDVQPGQVVALVGPSGAGKSTITHLVSRLYDVRSGAVRIGGHDVREVTLESLHRTVGVVSQDAHMFHDTIRGNLLLARPEATHDDLVTACRDAQIWGLVSSLPEGLDTVVGDRGYRLSGGEKQRLALARLLLKAPSIVVLDEATAHLDSESEVAVQRALATALQGRTAIVIAHRLSTIRDADQILVVDDGAIVERGTHLSLLAGGGLYADLYRTQFAQQDSPSPMLLDSDTLAQPDPLRERSQAGLGEQTGLG
ncbi:ABC transporter ATP-binding protein [Angustibacter sp. McL0619]|uniref:ABC transporter ATP-binding protein n=1 Tax=Angustibacter sp. McL0619 TaxID=3415676 RepID=UPI003CF47E0A